MLTRISLLIIALTLSLTNFAQNVSIDYGPSKDFPYGRINPDAPEQLKDYELLIGECDCKSEKRNPDKTWAKPVKMKWRFKYILNGMAVQDETLKEDGTNGGSIRQYSKDSARWYVHYYTITKIATKLPVWEGNKKGNDIVLYKEQKAPNGMEGYVRLTFSNISDIGFNWVADWVTKDESFVYTTWKISCIKRN